MTEIAYEDIKVDDEASLTRMITEGHIVNFAVLTGDWNPVHADAEYAAQSMFGERRLPMACSSRDLSLRFWDSGQT